MASLFRSWQRSPYHKVAGSSEVSFESDDDENKVSLDNHRLVSDRPSTLLIFTIVNIVCLILSASLFASWFYETHLVRNAAFRRTSSFSPLLDLFDLEPSTQKINGTFYPGRNPSLGRQMPNPDADDVWAEYEHNRVFPISSAEVIRLGKDPSTAVKLEDEFWGLGDDAYAAELDVFHLVHCLNALRQIAYGGYYNKTQANATSPPSWNELHINHCVDVLLQTLKCSGNLNLITYHWVETEPYPYPDMSINRQCVNFDKLTQWRIENTVSMNTYSDVFDVKPKGVKQMPAPEGKFKYLWHTKRPSYLLPAPSEDYNL